MTLYKMTKIWTFDYTMNAYVINSSCRKSYTCTSNTIIIGFKNETRYKILNKFWINKGENETNTFQYPKSIKVNFHLISLSNFSVKDFFPLIQIFPIYVFFLTLWLVLFNVFVLTVIPTYIILIVKNKNVKTFNSRSILVGLLYITHTRI